MDKILMKKIDLDLVLADLEDYCYSELSVKNFKELKYIKSYEELQLLNKENEEVEKLYKKYKGEFKLKIFDYYESLKKAKINSSLSSKELYYILRNLELYRAFKMKFNSIKNTDTQSYPIIESYIERVSETDSLREYLNKIVDEDGYIKADASNELWTIKNKIKSLNEKSDKLLRTIIRSNSSKLTESIVTKRNDRYVILVKPEYKNDFGGIIHDQSASGNTLYIEPRENVIINNEVTMLLRKEKEEIERILLEATKHVGVYIEELQESLYYFSKVEFIFSKINFSISKGFEKPVLKEEQIIDLKNAYNPLIDKNTLVKNGIYLDNVDSSLIITGPNTGGKTVILKTVALCVVLSHLGLYIPADRKSKIGFFESIFIDIGDEQSISNNLSTFSSHMKNIIFILNQVNDKSLVLLDELCSGTDPSEGAALSMAILNKFKNTRTTLLCTTHYPEIKDYCFKSNYYRNSSLEFDFDTLKPTYKFIIGLPGKSNAINISFKLGLEDKIIEEANDFIKETEKENSLFIDKLAENIKTYDNKIEQLTTELSEVKTIKTTFTKNIEEFNRYKDSLYEKAYAELNKEIEEKKEELYEIYKSFKNTSESIKQHEFNEIISSMNKNKQTIQTKPLFKEVTENSEIVSGDDVVFLKYNQRAEVLSIDGTGALIKLGNLKINVKLSEIKKIEKEKQRQVKQYISKKSNSTISLDINVIGKNTEDALRDIDDYIDKVLLQGYDTFTIIHGLGSGILKKNIAEYLKNNRYVDSFRNGAQGEGGLGVTIVEMK